MRRWSLSDGEDTANLRGRVERLVRGHRRLKRVTAAGLITALSLGSAAFYAVWERQTADEVAARRFTLRDLEGKLRASLTVREDGGATLYFPDQNGAPRAMLGVSVNGTPALAMSDKEGTLRAAVSVSPDGAASVGFFDGRATLRARLGTEGDGLPSLQLLDDKHGVRAVLSVEKDRSLLRIADGNGQVRLGMGLSNDSPGIVVFDRDGVTITKIP